MLEAVIFDMDGVIVDSEPINFAAERKIFNDLGIRLSDAEHQSYVGLTGEAMWSSIKKKHGLKQSVNELNARSQENYARTTNMSAFNAIPGVIPLVRELRAKHLPTAVASSSPPGRIRHILNALGITDQFSVIVAGDQVRNSKPAPDIFLEAADRLGKTPASCLVIEDSQAGVLAAQAAGMSCIGFKNPSSGSQDLTAADTTIEAFDHFRFEDLVRIHREARNQR